MGSARTARLGGVGCRRIRRSCTRLAHGTTTAQRWGRRLDGAGRHLTEDTHGEGNRGEGVACKSFVRGRGGRRHRRRPRPVRRCHARRRQLAAVAGGLISTAPPPRPGCRPPGAPPRTSPGRSRWPRTPGPAPRRSSGRTRSSCMSPTWNVRVGAASDAGAEAADAVEMAAGVRLTVGASAAVAHRQPRPSPRAERLRWSSCGA